jgi:predicted dithiol-disulfide oxidoreductase (DUF899 family)
MATRVIEHPKVVSPSEWLAARQQLLAKEKALTRQRDALSAARRRLPWVKLDKNYVFETPTGKKSLADLFDGKSQLTIYHFMFGPDWEEGCPSCSMAADGFDATTLHLAQRDVSFVAVSRARLPQIESFKKRMGWHFSWVSSFGSDFNRDFRVSFTKEELAAGPCYNYSTSGFPREEAPGLSVFYKDTAGNIFHTYSTYGRGLEEILGVYIYLDRVPKGRHEDRLPFPMAWVRHHDRYDATSTPRAADAVQSTQSAAHSCCADHK